MNHDATEAFDVLGALDDNISSGELGITPIGEESTSPLLEESKNETTQELIIMDDSHIFFEEKFERIEGIENSSPEILTEKEEQEVIKKVAQHGFFWRNIVFLFKYISTSALIFAILLLSTNFSAYRNIAMSYIFQKDFEAKSQSLLNSVEASSLSEHFEEQKEEGKVSLESAKVKKKEEEFNSIQTLGSKANRADVDLGITITPYENRIIIPKIGKNIPLLDITQQSVEGIDELNDIFMDELENGVIRYPGSAKPGEDGNTFVFGHSSNFPWMEGEYNDVFALLDKVVFDDEIVVYYGQEKYTYKIRKKEVISPGDVGILKRDKGRSEITLMTCWPIGTTLNRLILIGDLVEDK